LAQTIGISLHKKKKKKLFERPVQFYDDGLAFYWTTDAMKRQ
jgi:hypothetical protein